MVLFYQFINLKFKNVLNAHKLDIIAFHKNSLKLPKSNKNILTQITLFTMDNALYIFYINTPLQKSTEIMLHGGFFNIFLNLHKLISGAIFIFINSSLIKINSQETNLPLKQFLSTFLA